MVAVPKALSILTVSQSPWSPFAASLVLEHALSVKAAVSPMATVKLHRRLTGLAVGSVIFLLAGCCMQPDHAVGCRNTTNHREGSPNRIKIIYLQHLAASSRAWKFCSTAQP